MITVTLAGVLLLALPVAPGWKLAAALTPITYTAWSLWLVVCGIALLL